MRVIRVGGRRLAAWAGLLGGQALLLLVAVSMARAPVLRPVASLGNSPENVARLAAAPADGSYAFAVMGDSRNGLETFETLIDRTARGGVAFGVHLGDFVPYRTDGEFAFMLHEFSEHAPYPLFVAPGNHDVAADGDAEAFRRALGPTQTFFSYGGDLFLIADNAVRPAEESLPWLEEVLKRHAPGKGRIFLFMHRPVFAIDKKTDRMAVDPNSPLHQFAKRWGIGYVFFGHYHSYLRAEMDGVRYVVTGGAGSPLYGRRAFHHAMILDVGRSAVQETLVTTRMRIGLEDDIAHWVYRWFYAPSRARPIVFWGALLLAQSALLAWTVRLRRR